MESFLWNNSWVWSLYQIKQIKHFKAAVMLLVCWKLSSGKKCWLPSTFVDLSSLEHLGLSQEGKTRVESSLNIIYVSLGPSKRVSMHNTRTLKLAWHYEVFINSRNSTNFPVSQTVCQGKKQLFTNRSQRHSNKIWPKSHKNDHMIEIPLRYLNTES